MNRTTPLLFALALAACGQAPEAPPAPLEIAAGSTCDLDGMLLADYPGPKGQIHYKNEAQPHWYCDTLELLAMLKKPEQVRAVRAAYVQDMAAADWASPRGHWIDARSAWYVLGSRKKGSMGPTAASFGTEAAAQTFATRAGGKVMAFDAITPEATDLSGGAQHDGSM